MPQPNQDRITETLVGPQTLGQRFNDIGDAIQSVIAGRSTFGEAMNASRAARLREALAVEDIKNNRSKLTLAKQRYQLDLQEHLRQLDKDARDSKNSAIKDVWTGTLKPVVSELVKTDPNKVGQILTDFHRRVSGADENSVDYATVQGAAAATLRGFNIEAPTPKAQSPVGQILSDLAAARIRGDEESVKIFQGELDKRLMNTSSVINVRLPSGQMVSGPQSSKRIQDALSNGGVRVNLNVQAGSVGELGISPKDQAKAALAAANSAFNISEGFSLLGAVKTLGPGASGVRGAVGETAGGFAGQVNESLGRSVTQAITGMSPEQLSAFRVRARQYVAQRLNVITGEESGRYTEAERALTNEALRVLESEASVPQIIGALESVQTMEIMSQERNALMAGIKVPKYHLRTPETDAELNALAENYNGLGLSNESVIDLVKRLLFLHEQYAKLTGAPGG